MKIYNPSPEQIIAKCAGVAYVLDPGFFIDVPESIGSWLMQESGFLGLVDLTPKPPFDKDKLKSQVIRKSLEGLETYITHIHSALEQYVELDTELKQQNLYGTVLKHKNVRRLSELLEQATRMVKDIEQKYGISLAKAETETKSKTLLASIDSMVAEFEADIESQQKAKEQDSATNDYLKTIIPESFGMNSGNHAPLRAMEPTPDDSAMFSDSRATGV